MTKQGMDLLLSFEGLRLSAYMDVSGTPTIGVGCTFYEDGTKVKMGDTITSEEALRLCRSLVENVFEKWVRDNIMVTLTDYQIDALTSLCYNIGTGNLQNSTVWRLINAHAHKEDIENAWRLWNKSKGAVLRGLVLRREKEIQYFYSHEPEILYTSPESSHGIIYKTMKPTLNPSLSKGDKLAFLQAPRFWCLLLLSAATVLGNEGIISAGVLQGIQLLLGGFIGVRTLDRSVEHMSQKT